MVLSHENPGMRNVLSLLDIFDASDGAKSGPIAKVAFNESSNLL